ncbi:MAG TPA: penicillin-binding protein 2 [Thermoleophilaceae bacterium]|nr:penicillin-binding protein 2 [Thermoleophilaceae bacterium]
MYLDSDRRGTAMSPGLALRIAILGGVALVMFAIVFFRLWYLQVLSGDHYLAQANNNRVREIKTPAPRGKIVDRNGHTLVDNRPAQVVEIAPDKLPKTNAEKTQLYTRLGRVLHMTRRDIRSSVRDQLRAVPFSAAIVKTDVKLPVVEYLSEHASSFPGVTVDKIWLRSYPYHQVAAHIFGTVGEVTEPQLKERRYSGVTQGDRVGQSGIEYSYDRFLRGKNGARRVLVDASGDPRGTLGSVPSVPGHQLRLSLDLDVQRVGQQAISSDEGAFVAMDVHTGALIGLGSNPSFDPNLFSKGIKQSVFKRLNSDANGAPLIDRAIQGGYPTGSTFKLITATAALEGGIISPDTPLYDPGYLKVGGVTFKNAEGAVHGALSLRKALTVSDDVFFYKLGLEANNTGNGHLIQKWAARYGLGHLTGVDVPGELPGTIPSPEWRNQLFKKKLTDRPWTPGDNINLAVGQGDVRVSPLQLATAYAALANGGTVLRPHLGERIEDASGRVVQEFHPRARRKIHINPGYRQAILDGLRGAASAPGGTSTAVFQGFPIPIAGKTGTAEKGLGRKDQSWYVALAPYPNPRYVVVVTAEHGGFGADTAAPEARKILAAMFGIKDKGPAPNPNAGQAGVAAPTVPVVPAQTAPTTGAGQ